MKLWRPLTAHGFAQNVKCSASRTHMLILSATWEIQTGLALLVKRANKDSKQPFRNKPISISGLKFACININSIRGKKK